ncbi:hypothetical protein BCR44DRAFT_49779 [Catenaria anguillulae PL171]|uniref:Uncharacterized protein n=1 Tax=Catenaria anguillulae PL171 TaxID=765915 RepID=A0A1Y2I598_9FUNG|nr:hypothetical protein BCR44DRAFT_49779 [Catenaria anguillulae PL171]
MSISIPAPLPRSRTRRSSPPPSGSRFLAAVLLVLALVSVLAVPTASAYTLNYKTKKLNSLVRESNVLTLDGTAFEVITEAPRNYSLVVLLTALDPQIGCSICAQFDPEFRGAAYSWQAAKGKHPLYFASLDFVSGRDVFQKVKLNSAPNVYFYPATEGPHKLPAPTEGDFVQYDLIRKGVSAHGLIDFLSDRVNERFTFTQPPDYTKIVTYFGAGVAIFLLRRYIFLVLQLIFFGRKIYALGSLFGILLFTGGYMWNTIRSPPFMVTDRQGNAEYVANGLQQQHGIETQITALLHGVCAFATVALIVAVPKLKSAWMQRLVTCLLLVSIVGAYSVVMRMFRIKSPGYPYKMLL